MMGSLAAILLYVLALLLAAASPSSSIPHSQKVANARYNMAHASVALKSCEPLRELEPGMLYSMRNHIQQLTAAARRLQELEYYIGAKKVPPEDPALAYAFKSDATLQELLDEQGKLNSKSDMLKRMVRAALSEIKSELELPEHMQLEQLIHCFSGRLNPALYEGRPRVSFLLQYFKRPGVIGPLVSAVKACNATWPSELLVNVDHKQDAAFWAQLAYNTSGMVVPVISNDVHEVRAYNRLAAAARGSVLVMLQDDELLSGDCSWLNGTLSILTKYRQVAIVGMNGCKFGFYEDAATGECLLRDVQLGLGMQFCALVDFAPLAVRRSVFLQLGGLDEGISEPGECGIYSDWELSARAWAAGHWVAYSSVPIQQEGGQPGSTHAGPSPARCWGKQMDVGGHLFNTRFSGNFERPGFHDEVFEMVADLNRKFLVPAHDGPAKCFYSNKTCASIAERLEQRTWLSDNLHAVLNEGGVADASARAHAT